MRLHQVRLDRLINRLCEVRNQVSANWDVDFHIESQLGGVEEAVEQLSETVEEELKE